MGLWLEWGAVWRRKTLLTLIRLSVRTAFSGEERGTRFGNANVIWKSKRMNDGELMEVRVNERIRVIWDGNANKGGREDVKLCGIETMGMERGKDVK